MTLKLVFLNSFDTEFKGQNYKIFRFLDINSLTILTGTNLVGEFKEYQVYNCKIEFNHNKLKVVGIS